MGLLPVFLLATPEIKLARGGERVFLKKLETPSETQQAIVYGNIFFKPLSPPPMSLNFLIWNAEHEDLEKMIKLLRLGF